ncbi:ankyrin [Zopfia rhizophila CBS 207.26]|uniref:Ankyrin n=1 Tax=Zopfia rhizophila CBS 207.26 TaxID=1314779 RepID=A0A6A6ECP4_9PEZI|nr:ankyrin [Zopfia rhizophila CBS 207.26]
MDPPKATLSDLPSEIFREILMRAVQVRELKRALRLRLVNKLFSTELTRALSAAKLLDEIDVKVYRIPLAGSYLALRTLEERTTAYPMLNRIREVAERLAAEDKGPLEFRDYVVCLASQAARGDVSMSALFHKEASIEEELEFDLLAAAVVTNHLSLVESLTPAHTKMRFGSFGNPYYEAVYQGHLEALTLLVSGTHQLKSHTKYRILQKASRKGDTRTVDFIIKAYWSPYKDDGRLYRKDEAVNQTLRTPNVQIFHSNMAEREKLFAGQLPRDLLARLICYAATNGWTEMTRHLITLGAPLEVSFGISFGGRQNKPLYCASEGGFDGTVELLLENGAQICGTELLGAAQHGYLKTVKVLLNHGADVHCTGTKDALSVAARGGYFEVVRLLLDHGMDANQGSSPPIVQAVESEHTAIFELLVERGANLDTPEVGAEAVKRAHDAGMESMLALLKRTMRQNQCEEISAAG